MACDYSSPSFKKEAVKKLSPFKTSSESKEKIKEGILKEVSSLGESRAIDTSYHLDEALGLIKKILKPKTDTFKSGYDPDVIPDDTQLKGALLSWTSKREDKKEKENCSSERLNKFIENHTEDPFEEAFGKAFYAKLKAKQMANTTAIHCLLFNENGVINTQKEMDDAIEEEQEKLFEIIKNYLQSQGVDVSTFPASIYDSEGNYTGAIDSLGVKLFFTSISESELIKANIENNQELLNAYNAFVILDNFDAVIKQIFGKAININPDSDKFQLGKYQIAGGSNVYNTWRVSEEIDLSKEINNITQAIVNSIPYIDKKGTVSTRNLKFNEFCYIITKIKDLPNQANGDLIIRIEGNHNLMNVHPVSLETRTLVEGQSFLSLINNLRLNPQEYIPAILELLNNDSFIEELKINKVISENTFLEVDYNLINSIHKGLFDLSNPQSLYAIQHKGKGFQGVNYYSFITQTMDSIFKAGFMQYFRDPEGKIYCRNMFDQSVSAIEWNIKDAITSINSDLVTDNYDAIKDSYNLREENSGNTKILKMTIPYGDKKLDINYSLNSGKVTFTIEGKSTNVSNRNWDEVSGVIQQVLRQNFDVDREYLEAFIFQLGKGTSYAETLLELSARVLFNQYIQQTHLKGLTPRQAKEKLQQLFPEDKTSIPTYNSRLKQINLISDISMDTITRMAQAKALVTGRLTSSQILDGEGNALSSNNLSRLSSSVLFQVEQQVKQEQSAAKDFSIWKPGVFKGIQQLKEIKDQTKVSGQTKSHVEFSAAEMEYAELFLDFLQGMDTRKKIQKSPIGNGLVTFYPSENSDKTYIGRMIIDLNNIIVPTPDGGSATLYEAIRDFKQHPHATREVFLPIIFKELGQFYQKAIANINTEWAKVGLAILEQTGHSVNIKWDDFSDLEKLAATIGTTVPQLVHDTITRYNNENPTKPIVLIDQVHYVEKSNTFTPNTSLQANLERFENIVNLEKFLVGQETDLLRCLLKDKLRVPSNPDILRMLGPEWIDPYTNEVILAKEWEEDLNGKTKVKNIRREMDVEDWRVNAVHGFQLNPLIESYNLLNYFFTTEFMNSTVGAYYAHPSKDKTGVPLLDEKSRKTAQDKRNVSFTAAMHAFQHNLIEGIPDEINIAVMPDVTDYFQTISGETIDMKPFDGATFENPFFGKMENASLGGAKVGLNKKTFTHFYDERTGTGGIIKTANFPLTNNNIRNSRFYQIMMQNMTDRVWRNENGEIETDLNVLEDYNHQPIAITNPNSENGQLFFKDNKGRNWAILAPKYLGNNKYQRILKQVDSKGRPVEGENTPEILADMSGNFYRMEEDVSNGDTRLVNIDTGKIVTSVDELDLTVDTNYKLWKMFGGERALELKGDSLTWSEHSIDQVFKMINNVGRKKAEIEGPIRFQRDVWQPLKHADIHIMPTVGAIKQGAANINQLSSYTEANANKINFMRIKLNQSGIQLDKEHHADGEDLSIMTQVLSACAARGYTQEQCAEMYNALAALARQGVREFQDNFDEFFRSKGDSSEAKQKYEKAVQDVLINALSHSSNDQVTLNIVTRELLEKARKGEEFEFQDIPYSDPSVFRKLHSVVSVALTKAAVKIKVDGLLSVLCPSYNAVKIYNGKLYGSFNSPEELVNEQVKADGEDTTFVFKQGKKVDLGNLRLGRTYLITFRDKTQELRLIRTHDDYYELRSLLPDIETVKEQFAPIPEENFEGGRELAPYHASFKIVGERRNQDSELPMSPSQIRSILDATDYKNKIAKARQLGLEVEEPDEGDIRVYVAHNLGGLDYKSIASQLGWKSKDFQKLLRMLRTPEKGGHTVDSLAENIQRALDPALMESYDDYDIKQIILDLFQEAESPNYFKYYGIDQVIDQALSYYENEYDAYIEQTITASQSSYSISDLASVKRLADLQAEKREGTRIVTEEELTQALNDVQKDLSVLSGLKIPSTTKIHITGDSRTTEAVAEQIGGIDVLRHPDPITGMHYGNPFSHGGYAGTIKVNTVKEAVEAFEAWLRGESTYKNINLDEVEPERRAWIQEKINSGELYGKTLVYYTNKIPDLSYGVQYYSKDAPSHAHILQELIDEAAQKRVTLIGGIQAEVDLDSVEIEPYEIVMPKLFAEVFGLTTYDDINTIKDDPDFFVKRLLQKISNQKGIKSENYSIGLMRMNGKHTYLLDRRHAVEESENFRRKKIKRERINGILYRISEDGEKLYRLNENDEVWEHRLNDGTVAEVIITDRDNFSSYIKSIPFNTFNISEHYLGTEKDALLDVIRKSNTKQSGKYLRMLRELGGRTQDIIALQNVSSIDNIKDSPFGEYFTTLGKKIHSSFLKSLNVVAARVPAQCMQSFMPMKVVAFDAPDINTAYVSTAQFLFQGSDLDIDAVSLASFAFDKNGLYILHSPYANIESYDLLKASETLPFPTGKSLLSGAAPEDFRLSPYLTLVKEGNDVNTIKESSIPLYYMKADGTLRINNSNPQAIKKLGELIRKCNELGYIPMIPGIPVDIQQKFAEIINNHNEYLKDKNCEAFSKNYIVTKMFDIGLSPANLIQSQQAMDSITKPLKQVAELTIKAKENTLGNPANFTTNVRGLIQNMSGKKGVGICAVGLKGFFAATARYNEVLAHGTPEEQRKLLTEVEIAKKKFHLIANAYTAEQVNDSILATVLSELSNGKDAALLLSALLSLSVDNAKELALDKLNAENMLGMYIYGISIGMDFKDIAQIVASRTGILINELMKNNMFSDEKGMSIQNIYDYLELGPTFSAPPNLLKKQQDNFEEYLSREGLMSLKKDPNRTLAEKLQLLESLKTISTVENNIEGTREFNRIIEKAQEWLQYQEIIEQDQGGEIYKDFKKLNDGGEELRILGQMLHVNQGLESSYQSALNYRHLITSCISTRQYSLYREKIRETIKNGGKREDVKMPELSPFNLHLFVSEKSYREACIDAYGGTIDKKRANTDDIYAAALMDISRQKVASNAADYLINLPKSRVFFNILDILQVPHYLEYINEADQLHQAMMLMSIKYRAIYNLGTRGIAKLRAFSQKDTEQIFRRTEQLVDSIMRDRFLLKEPKFLIPKGQTLIYKSGSSSLHTGEAKENTRIQLGTREGNGTFKLYMEQKVIPDLIELSKHPTIPDPNNPNKSRKNPLYGNKFIQSLTPTIFSDNPEFTTTTCYAPSINMSPRSDTDKYIFEETKQDFNRLKGINYSYDGMDIINLFWMYNQIAFQGKVGENTLTNIFQDVLDHKMVKRFRQFESELDETEDFNHISDDTLLRRLALKRSPWNSTMSNFYYENFQGESSYWSKNVGGEIDENFDPSLSPEERPTRVEVRGYSPTRLDYAVDENLKNVITTSQDTEGYREVPAANYDGGKYKFTYRAGKVESITVIPDDPTQEAYLFQVPLKRRSELNIPKRTVIRADGVSYEEDIPLIQKRIKGIIEETLNKNNC